MFNRGLILLFLFVLSAPVLSVDDITAELLLSKFKSGITFDGKWSAKGGSGPHSIEIYEDRYNPGTLKATEKGKSSSETYRWVSTVTIVEPKKSKQLLCIKVQGRSIQRTGTYCITKKRKKIKLSGGYTYKGKPWGKYKSVTKIDVLFK